MTKDPLETIGRPKGLNPNIDYAKPTPAQQNSLDLRAEINGRLGCRILVSTQEERNQMVDVLELWLKKGELRHMPEVYASTRVEPGKVVVDG